MVSSRFLYVAEHTLISDISVNGSLPRDDLNRTMINSSVKNAVGRRLVGDLSATDRRLVAD